MRVRVVRVRASSSMYILKRGMVSLPQQYRLHCTSPESARHRTIDAFARLAARSVSIRPSIRSFRSYVSYRFPSPFASSFFPHLIFCSSSLFLFKFRFPRRHNGTERRSFSDTFHATLDRNNRIKEPGCSFLFLFSFFFFSFPSPLFIALRYAARGQTRSSFGSVALEPFLSRYLSFFHRLNLFINFSRNFIRDGRRNFMYVEIKECKYGESRSILSASRIKTTAKLWTIGPRTHVIRRFVFQIR